MISELHTALRGRRESHRVEYYIAVENFIINCVAESSNLVSETLTRNQKKKWIDYAALSYDLRSESKQVESDCSPLEIRRRVTQWNSAKATLCMLSIWMNRSISSWPFEQSYSQTTATSRPRESPLKVILRVCVEGSSYKSPSYTKIQDSYDTN